MRLTFDLKYRAISARDRRFDGQFIFAVRTTGIYCRPSCPARTPNPSNVEFFAVSAAAHEAGYRACKRCLPDAAPGSPEWDLRGDVVGRVMKLIADGEVERSGVTGLATHLGYSTRHLTRLMTEEIGAGPLALARAQRAHTARILLVNTPMPVSDIAFAAGFGSIRQFNDTFREIFDLTPSELRTRTSAAPRAGVGAELASAIPRHEPHAPAGSVRSAHLTGGDGAWASGVPQGVVDLALPYREPLDAAGIFRWFADRALPGVEVAEADSYSRTLALPGGPAWFRVYASGSQLRLSVRLAAFGDLPFLIARVRRLFDLDADPEAIDDALASQPELAARVEAIPGIRVPGASDPHEMLIRAMVGQQITVASARTALTRLTDAHGERVDGDPDTTILFPTMLAIAERGHEVLRGPAARVVAIRDAAAALASGDLVLDSAGDSRTQREALLARRGIGPWTADYVRMRVTGDPDVVLPGDVVVRNGAARLGIPSTARELDGWAVRTSPWRSYLTAHLWRAPHAPVQETHP